MSNRKYFLNKGISVQITHILLLQLSAVTKQIMPKINNKIRLKESLKAMKTFIFMVVLNKEKIHFQRWRRSQFLSRPLKGKG